MGKIWEIARGEEGYPQALEDLGESAPARLYGVGDTECLSMPCISIVGARKATPYGVEVAEMAARVAVECDLVVVSGGAAGCDHAASRSAIDSGGRTIIVSACGADVVYPDTSRDIFHDAVRHGGAVISIVPWKTKPRRYSFPRRNAIIAALSRSLFVTEAGLKSGTMSTADVASQLGRNIYAIPGSIFSPNSQGANSLIATGASIIASEMDLQTQIGLDYDSLRMVVEDHYDGNSQVISALIASPMRPDELSARLGQSLLTLMATLADYESQGLVAHLLDGRYSVTHEAYDKYFRRARERQGIDDPSQANHTQRRVAEPTRAQTPDGAQMQPQALSRNHLLSETAGESQAQPQKEAQARGQAELKSELQAEPQDDSRAEPVAQPQLGLREQGKEEPNAEASAGDDPVEGIAAVQMDAQDCRGLADEQIAAG